MLPTPPELVNRALPTVNRLPPPGDGAPYASTVAPVPGDVLARSTWQPSCPVAANELRYLTMSFWGFDGHAHTGEMIVNTRVAVDVTKVFKQLYDARFPLEEMRVAAAPELTAAPTGDGNNTTAFVCRSAVRQTRWSAHAYGLAIDLNPFCNPYIRGRVERRARRRAAVDADDHAAGLGLVQDVRGHDLGRDRLADLLGELRRLVRSRGETLTRGGDAVRVADPLPFGGGERVPSFGPDLVQDLTDRTLVYFGHCVRSLHST